MDEDCQALRTFKDLKLNTWLTDQCKTMGLTAPTLVQLNCIPPILEGKDCIGCAKTGSGKTLAFALPILQKLSEDPYGIFALVLTPTRELAFQIADQFRVFGKPIGLKDCVIVGGMDMMIQGKELAQSPHIIISTPGRLADHLESCNTFSLKRIKFLVLDEADRLLEGHFNEQLKTIFEALPKKRQTLLFSATMTQTLEELRNIAMTNPYFWSAPAAVATVEELDQRYVLVPSHVRDAYLVHVVKNFVERNPKGSVIIFTSTCKSCHILSMAFKSLGFETTALHSMISQRLRLAALASFKSNNVKIMIATDVASRGLDIPQVEMVINYNVPSVAKDYVHRVGRTARAGRGGMAVTLVTQYDINLIHAVEKLINTKLTLLETKEKEVLNILTQVAVAMREAEIRLDEIDFGEKRMINKRKKLILEGKDPEKEERKKQLRKKLKEKSQRRKQKLRRKEKIKSKQAAKSEDPT
ncbi:probable ATP-dependent RNA helicase DDX49 [Limulus polyphemus]|uniref:Probable ATP-dependent RNA helicase DDX49 n=1 Tax=Limulus polyphemus TaxID=6850 RepID=A0ABM1BND0_LIMPO|nr:probable ATP-dependent RNA helicase DDX49 [Limulus polyphemus]